MFKKLTLLVLTVCVTASVTPPSLSFGGSPPPPPPVPCTIGISDSEDIIRPGTSVNLRQNGTAGNCTVARQDVPTPVSISVVTGSYVAQGGFRVISAKVVGGLSGFAWSSSVSGRLIQSSCDLSTTLCEIAPPIPSQGNRVRDYKQFRDGTFCYASSTYQSNAVIVLEPSCYFKYKFNRLERLLAFENLGWNTETNDPRGDPPVGGIYFTDNTHSLQQLAAFTVNTNFIQ